MARLTRSLALLFCLAALCAAHVGSSDIYLDGKAGPYKLFVTIRPPQVIPGVAEIDVRSETPGVVEMKAVPLPLAGDGSDHPPVPDTLRRSSSDEQFYTGALWLMADGSWQVRITVDGSQGPGTLSVPVPAVARTVRAMQWQLGALLCLLGIFLVGGLVAICGAAVREAKLPAQEQPAAPSVRKGRIASLVAFVVVALALWGGKAWWDSEVAIYKGRVYKPLQMQAALENGNTLRLNLSEPGWMQPAPGPAGRLSNVLFVRKMDDLVLDHDHLMHLYVVREPGLDMIYHLHPEMVQPDQFRLSLPSMPAGTYNLYADVVHENGLPETLTATLSLPNGIAKARPLSGDDAAGQAQPVGASALSDVFILHDGYRMKWIRDSAHWAAGQGREFQFALLKPDGSTPSDMALYMGMVGHAAFLKTDGTVFAHIHPNGTVSMAALMLAQGNKAMPGMDMTAMSSTQNDTVPNVVTFPYGFPNPGAYRIFVQMKHGSVIETGAFDANVN